MSRLDPGIYQDLRPFQNPDPTKAVQLADLMSQKKERDAQTAFRLQETNRLKQQQDKSDAFNQALSEAGGQAYDENEAELPVANHLRQIDPVQADAVLPKLKAQAHQNRIQKSLAGVDQSDPQAVIKALSFDPEESAKYAKNVYDALHAQSTAAEAQTKQFQNWHNQISAVANPQTIKDETSFNALKQQAPQLLQSMGVPPQVIPHFMSDLGDSYDPVETPKRLEVIRQESMDEQRKIADAKEKLDAQKGQIAEDQKYPSMIREELKSATSQPLFTKARATLQAMHIPDTLLNQFVPEEGEDFPTFAERMRKGALTADQIQKSEDAGNKPGDDLQSYLKDKAAEKGRALTPKERGDLTEKFKTLGPAYTAEHKTPPMRLIQTVDENNNPIQKFVPEEEGASYAVKPPAVMQTRQNQASIIEREADAITSMIDAHPEVAGPIWGRITKGEAGLGTVGDAGKALQTRLGSFSALQPILHGFRGGGQTVEHFDKIIGDQSLNPSALKASLAQIKALATDIRTGKAPEEATGKIKVQIPGHPVGTIPAAAWPQFLKDNPTATQIK